MSNGSETAVTTLTVSASPPLSASHTVTQIQGRLGDLFLCFPSASGLEQVNCQPLSKDKLTNRGGISRKAQALLNLQILVPDDPLSSCTRSSFLLALVLRSGVQHCWFFPTAFQGVQPFPWRGRSRINTLCTLLLSSDL